MLYWLYLQSNHSRSWGYYLRLNTRRKSSSRGKPNHNLHKQCCMGARDGKRNRNLKRGRWKGYTANHRRRKEKSARDWERFQADTLKVRINLWSRSVISHDLLVKMSSIAFAGDLNIGGLVSPKHRVK